MPGLNSVFTPLQNLPWEAQLAGMAVIGGWKVLNYINDKDQVAGVRKDFQDNFRELYKQSYTAPQVPAGDAVWRKTVPVSLFVRTDDQYGVDDITFDVIVEESHQKGATVSEHPVEEDSPITDHIQLNLRTLTMKVLVSNYSVNAAALIGDAGVDNRAAQVWSRLKNLVDEKKLVRAVSILEKYPDMAITSVSTARKAATGDALEFDITARQVRVIRVRNAVLTGIVKHNDPALSRQTNKKVDPGAQVAKDAQEKKAKSAVLDKYGIITRAETAAGVGTDKGAIVLHTDGQSQTYIP